MSAWPCSAVPSEVDCITVELVTGAPTYCISIVL